MKEAKLPGEWGNKGYDWDKLPVVPPCRHYLEPVQLPDGVVVHGSSHHRHEPGDVPDLGLYLDYVWKPQCIAYMLDWPDFKLPSLPLDKFVYQLGLVHDEASQGYTVEIGCIGGHGRTGTALACMAVLAGLEPEAAILYIREKYCEKAVETEQQEWLVEAVWCHLHDKPIPEKPAEPVVHAGVSKDANKGKEAIVKQDWQEVDYCGSCLTDVQAQDTACVWCGAQLTFGGKK